MKRRLATKRAAKADRRAGTQADTPDRHVSSQVRKRAGQSGWANRQAGRHGAGR